MEEITACIAILRLPDGGQPLAIFEVNVEEVSMYLSEKPRFQKERVGIVWGTPKIGSITGA
ncbi:hypothetical protein GN244_ATG13395 [Phytophthora infestans]|uniref:Uncharacterized protein n=1 Tax=Phytophthora infestans TaxID=4787 RepID=A0A833SHS0_PHYIN|nr:hypothetical protein GN244_ATG18326 [Phytophthora infestans]KAF4034652.1 hypothetical protein GN244_ATG13395 [Phytophthora infestans]KAF4140667.1 hypothetical protein GN958_ATG10144 [Phytophthora infestans]KAF4149102.1 hypothetical protein GN958_ATG01643 [Phytophthora infestans]